MRRLTAIGLGVVVMTAALCQFVVPASHAQSFRDQSCWFDADPNRKIRCGRLTVPENRSRSDGREINLPVVIFGARSEPAGAVPLLYITGGPGNRSMIGTTEEIEAWWSWIDRILPQTEVIVLGLRGTGREKPSLLCRPSPLYWAWPGYRPRGLDPKVIEERVIESVKACRDELLAKGADLTAYNSRETAADIADLRRALQIESWNLYGTSYGTRIALTVMRHFPLGLNAVILDSVFPPQAPRTRDLPSYLEAVLNRLFDDCRANEACRRDYPELDIKFEALRRRLAVEAAELPVAVVDFLPFYTMTLDHKGLAVILQTILYWDWPGSTEYLPMAIDQASSGDFILLGRLAAAVDYGFTLGDFSPPVILSFLCHEEVAFETEQDRKQAVGEAGRFGHLAEADWIDLLCPHWPAGEADDIDNEAVVSEIPTLLLAGSYDPITPPELARLAADGLALSYVLEFRNSGHGVLVKVSCAADVVAAFLARPSERPDPACLKAISPPDFAARSEQPPSTFYPR